ncbi:sugar kinase [Microbacterium sp. YY-01]|uniref:sugar kinase n=1 Tax=Microbacterium sp. YY-01 TaxID=3421634 RepID=UPI003D1778F5
MSSSAELSTSSVTPPQVVCVGESMLLVTPVNEPLSTALSAMVSLAGAESNVAAQLAASGHHAVWASRLGNDPLGQRICGELEARGVHLWVETDEHAPTGVMFKDPAAEGSSVYYYRRDSAASRMAPGFLQPEQLQGVRIVHVTGITAALSASCAAMLDQLIDDAHAAGALVSFDVNDRRSLWPLDEAATMLEALAQRADICFVGRDEAERLWGTVHPDAIRQLLHSCRTLVVKDGDVGATEFTDTAAAVFVAAPPVDVVEPVGAGDAFAAGYLGALLEGADATARLAAGHESAGRVLRISGDLPPLGE